MLSDSQKTDVRRFCGYPAYGASPAGNIGWRFYTAYGLLEYRMNNLSVSEIAVVTNYLAVLNQLEIAIPGASSNLDTEQTIGWTHNSAELADRFQLFDNWRRRLCAFLGLVPGEGLADVGIGFVV